MIPLNGFDAQAWAVGTSHGPARHALDRAEFRDAVAWLEHTNVREPSRPQIDRTVLDNLPADLRGKVYRIKMNGLWSVRITGRPINFLANKTDHYVPEDVSVEFIRIPMNERST